MKYPEICREAFALVDDIGKGAFNNEFSERGTLATTVEVAMPVLADFRELVPEAAKSVAQRRTRQTEGAGAEKDVFRKGFRKKRRTGITLPRRPLFPV